MDKADLEALDKSENERLAEIGKKYERDQLPVFSHFKDKIVKQTLGMGNQVFMSGFYRDMLPATVPFSDRVFVQICNSCECSKAPNLLMPYLERGLIVPVLNNDFALYRPDFIDAITQFPFISAAEFFEIRKFELKRESKMALASQREIEAIERKCYNSSKNFPNISNELERTLASIFNDLQPFYSSDIDILLNLMEGLDKKNASEINRIYDLSSIIGAFRTSQVLPFTPQVLVKPSTLKAIPREYKGITFDSCSLEDEIMTGLKISYNPSVGLEQYLDIIAERKSSIRKIVRSLTEQVNSKNDSSLKNLKAELERINSEVESLRTSKKLQTIDIRTNFVTQNTTSLVAGLVTSASMGIGGLGVINCGLNATTKKKGNASAKNAIGFHNGTFFDSSYERVLAKTLSTDIRVIQIWEIRNKLGT